LRHATCINGIGDAEHNLVEKRARRTGDISERDQKEGRMAELHIQRERDRTWIWAVAILIVLGSVAWLAFGPDERRDAADGMPPMTGASLMASDGELVGVPLPVNEYLRFVADSRAERDADHGHAYTADGLRRLAGALGALSERDGKSDENIQSRVTMLRDRADALQRDPQSTEHARYARDAFDAAAELMRAMQTEASSNAVAEASQAAGALEPNTMLLMQREAVQRFFDRAGTVLRAMNATAATT
jgi:hypothetical protein